MESVGWDMSETRGGVVDWAAELAPNASLPLLTRLIESETHSPKHDDTLSNGGRGVDIS